MMIKQGIKEEMRILGIDDGHFRKDEKEAIVIGTVFRGGKWMDGVLSTKVEVDGKDGTDNLIDLVRKSRHFGQLRCLMLNGIALAGFNIIGIKRLSRKTSLPVIVMIRKLPDFEKIKKALEKAGMPERFDEIIDAGEVHSTKTGHGTVYFQIAGIGKATAAGIIRMTAVHSMIPEPIRAAHLIASGVTLGESRKRV